jgi:two-component system, chemotaxis family, chemotaxis protein CheY
MSLKLDLSQIRFLLIDPNPLSADLTWDVLAMMGARSIRKFQTTERAIAAMRSDPFDIVIMEWNTTPMDGIEFLNHVRTSPTSPNRMMPILLMTARSEKEYVMQARDGGITEFLSKPFTVEALYKRLVSIIAYPRAFIDAELYFGPDRRRRADAKYQGPERREETTGSSG